MALGILMWSPSCSDGKESSCTEEDLGLITGLGRTPGKVNGYSLQYSCLENPMDRGAWWATVQGVARSWMRTSEMYKLGLEKADKPEIKLPTFVGSWRKQESSRKTSTSASLTVLKPLIWPAGPALLLALCRPAGP